TSPCFDSNAHHRRLLTAAAWSGLKPAPGSRLRRVFLHLPCSLCTTNSAHFSLSLLSCACGALSYLALCGGLSGTFPCPEHINIFPLSENTGQIDMGRRQ